MVVPCRAAQGTPRGPAWLLGLVRQRQRGQAGSPHSRCPLPPFPHREGEGQAHTAMLQGFPCSLSLGRGPQRIQRPETTVMGAHQAAPSSSGQDWKPRGWLLTQPPQLTGCLGPGFPPCSAKYPMSLPLKAFSQLMGLDFGQFLQEPHHRRAGLLWVLSSMWQEVWHLCPRSKRQHCGNPKPPSFQMFPICTIQWGRRWPCVAVEVQMK